MIPVLDWPANNTGTTLRENLLRVCNRRLRDFYPSDIEELKLVITEMWVLMSQEIFYDLFGSFTERMKEKVNAKKLSQTVKCTNTFLQKCVYWKILL